MKENLVAIVLVALCLAMSGCGTVCNFAGGVVHPDKEPRIYGGVQRDIEIIDKAVNAHPDNPPNMGKGAVYLIALAAVDTIVSFVADTLTLPITIPIQYWRERREEREDTYSSDSKDPKEPVIRLGPPSPIN
jgi:hypothetical protein